MNQEQKEAFAKIKKLEAAGVSMTDEEKVDFVNSMVEKPVELKQNSLEKKLEGMNSSEQESYLASIGLIKSNKHNEGRIPEEAPTEFQVKKEELTLKQNTIYSHLSEKDSDYVENLIEDLSK